MSLWDSDPIGSVSAQHFLRKYPGSYFLYGVLRENDKGDSRWGGSPLVFICNWGLEVFLQTQEVSAEAGTELVFALAVVDFGDGVDGDGIYTDIQHLYLLRWRGQTLALRSALLPYLSCHFISVMLFCTGKGNNIFQYLQILFSKNDQ